MNMEKIPLIFAGTAFIAFSLFLIGFMNIIRNRAEKSRMLEKIRQENPYKFSAANAYRKETRPPVYSFFRSFGKKIAPNKPEEYTRMRLRFYRAGIRNSGAPFIFWGLKGALLIGGAAVFLFIRLSTLKLMNFQYTLTGLVLSAAIGFYLPDLWLHFRTRGRKRTIFEGFPDALDLLVICVEAGMGLDASLARVGEEMSLSNPPLSDELKFLNLEIRAGKTREEALRNLALRTNIDDVQHLATLLIQTDRFGTSVAKALRVYADTFRTKRFQRAEEIAAKLPVKIVFPVTVFIFPALFVVIAGPAAIRVYQTFLH